MSEIFFDRKRLILLNTYSKMKVKQVTDTEEQPAQHRGVVSIFFYICNSVKEVQQVSSIYPIFFDKKLFLIQLSH